MIDTYEIDALDAPSLLEPNQIIEPSETNIDNSIPLTDNINYLSIIDE